MESAIRKTSMALIAAILSSFAISVNELRAEEPPVRGLTGEVTEVEVAAPTPDRISDLSTVKRTADLQLDRMAAWAMNYLISTPRKELNYEPVFQCHPLRCPPVPEGTDVVVSCDTDARMNWEWYYMRDVSGVKAGKEVEDQFHKRMLSFVQDDGSVLCHPGCFNEGDIHKVYEKKDYIIHIWGATKILHGLAEDFRHTKNEDSRAVGKKIIKHLKSLAVYPDADKCYLPCGMGAMRRDGTVVPHFWNRHPAPLVEPLVNYYLATGDEEALEFAKAYAEGIMAGSQPDSIRFSSDGRFADPLGHSHATMHALWGIAHLGVVTGEKRYVDFVKKSWDWMASRGTGTGWFPAMPDNCNETCCLSDMMSCAALIGEAGYPEYYDYVERFFRNYVSNLQFLVTPEFEAYYRRLNPNATPNQLSAALDELRKFQGGIMGGSGLNDWENELLGGTSGFEMFGCCAPEGMRAIYTAWNATIERNEDSKTRPAGVYVNLSLNRKSPWGEVVSFMPDEGRLTVKAAVEDTFYLRPPHWAPRDEVRAFRGTENVPVEWSGDYVRFAGKPGDELTICYPLIEFSHRVTGLWSVNPGLALTFKWRGNMVVSADPPTKLTPLFTGKPRLLPEPPQQ